MIKEVFIISGQRSERYEDFKSRIFEVARKINQDAQISKLKFTITEKPPPSFSIIPFQKEKMAVLSVYREDGKTELNTEVLIGHFLVEETLVVSYEKNWQDGEVTPGVCLLTLFRKKKGLDYDTFIERWHFGHSPLSLKIHPLWHYNRNVVIEELSDSEMWYDGIVEEHVKTPSELLNPLKFFGNPIKIIPNMIAVYRDVKSFIEYSSIESYLVQEYFLKT